MTTETYLASVESPEARALLERIRAIVREEVPDAEEVFSYGMPGFKFHGPLVWFAAFKNHCSLFPAGRVSAFADELKDFKTSKGTIQFTVEKPLPDSLVRSIVKARAAENLKKQGSPKATHEF
jgi:uncharacterized protein YdhG (YjbR/CyaY superfamily)